MNYQNIYVNGNRMEPNRIYAGTRGSYITDVSFSFSGEWEGLTKKLIFYPVRGTPVYTVYTHGTVRIPARVMRNAGISVMLISGYTVTEDGKIGKKIITASASVLVESADSDTRNEPDIPDATAFEEIVAKLGAPYIGESGNWYIWDVDTHEFVDTGLPARGEQGETGRGLTILGKYGSLEELRASVKDAQPGDAYAVGAKAPYTIYIWDAVLQDFTDHGDMRGVGISGIEQITDNTGSGEPNTIRITTDDGARYDYTVYNGERGHPGNIWIGETEPTDDSYTIWLNPGGAVSGFVESNQGTDNAGRALVVGEDGNVHPQYPAIKEWTKLPTFYKEVMTSGDFYVDVVKLDISKDLSDIPLGLYYDSGVNDSHGEKPYYYGTGVRIVDGEARLRQLVGTGPLVNINMITDEKIKITFFGADLNPQVIYTFDRTNRTLDASWIDSLSRLKTVELLKEKVDIDQGTENAGRVLVVGEDGDVRPTDWVQPDWVQPDWDQNDSTAKDYVKNRPFWTDDPVETVLFDGTVVNDDALEIELIVGQEYTVTLDGAEYVLTAWDDGEESVVLGSESVWWENDYVDTEPPFAVGVWGDGGWFYTINEGEEHTLRIVGHLVEIHKIDEKYLPDRIIGGIDTANYALGIATGAADLADGAVALASSVLRHYKANPIVYFTTTDQKTYTATLNGSSKAFLSGYVQYPAAPDNENTDRYATLYVNDIYVGIVLGIKYAVGNAVKDFVKIEIMDTLLCVETSGRTELTETTIPLFIAKYHGDFSEGIKTIKLVFNENDVVLSNDVLMGFGVYSTVA